MNEPRRSYYKQNRFKQLRAFCYAAQAGSISRAAERLFLSQPSVSLQVRALEQELAVTLFERKGPRIALTPDGRTLFELALPLVDGMDNLGSAFAERRGDIGHGELNVAAGESTILYILPPYMRRFSRQYPDVRLRLHNVTGSDGLAALRADEVDFAVGSLLDPPDDMVYRPIFHHDTVLITPPGHPLAARDQPTLEDIRAFGLILPPRNRSTFRIVDLVFQQHNLDYKVVLEAGGWEVIKKYVLLGLGVAIVSSICVEDATQLAVRPLTSYFPGRTYGIVLRKGKFLSPAAKRLVRMMDPRLAESHADGEM